MSRVLRQSKAVIRLAKDLFPENGSNYEQFISSLEKGDAGLQALILTKTERTQLPFGLKASPGFFPTFSCLPEAGIRPGKFPDHDQGNYYCLDASSVFEAVPFIIIPKNLTEIIDLCASPGGKSLCAFTAHPSAKITSNEVIGKRTAQLRSNIRRCADNRIEVVSRDVSLFADESADLVIVDAPCSGQSLIARGEKSEGCFLPHVIKHNAMRQRRIAANAARMLRPGGYLAYMTCTFSKEENEELIEWLIKRLPELETVEVCELSQFRSEYTETFCYRLWPFLGLGAGGFTALLRKRSNEAAD